MRRRLRVLAAGGPSACDGGFLFLFCFCDEYGVADIEGARRPYGQAVELDANHGESLGNWAGLLSDQYGEHEELRRLYKRRLAMEADSAVTDGNLGALLA